MVLDRHVLAFDVADFIEAFAERGPISWVRGPTDESNHGHRLLRLPLHALHLKSERASQPEVFWDALASLHLRLEHRVDPEGVVEVREL